MSSGADWRAYGCHVAYVDALHRVGLTLLSQTIAGVQFCKQPMHFEGPRAHTVLCLLKGNVVCVSFGDFISSCGGRLVPCMGR